MSLQDNSNRIGNDRSEETQRSCPCTISCCTSTPGETQQLRRPHLRALQSSIRSLLGQGKIRSVIFDSEGLPSTAQDYNNGCDNSISTAKYTAATFLPRNLFEQCRRKANLYFLLQSSLMTIGWYAPNLFESPVAPWSTLLTLMVVMGVTLVKDGVEDVYRHQSDSRENNMLVNVFRSGETTSIPKKQVRVGDYCVVQKMEEFPADLVLISTSNAQGNCYVETSNIDGETNLKVRAVPMMLFEMIRSSASSFHENDDVEIRNAWSAQLEAPKFSGELHCDPPNSLIQNFEGNMNVWHGPEQVGHPKEIAVDSTNFCPRGARLRNTDWAIGLVVYTGKETKIMQNMQSVPFKMSSIDVTVNRIINLVFLAHLCLVVLSVTLSYALRPEIQEFDSIVSHFFHVDTNTYMLPLPLANFFTFYILYGNMVPISLYVTIEMVNVVQSYFIRHDLDLYHEKLDIVAMCRNASLCQELGQIDHIFTDKTGTLTRNVMRLKYLTVLNKNTTEGSCHSFSLQELKQVQESQMLTDVDASVLEDIHTLIEMCATCNNVVPEKRGARFIDETGVTDSVINDANRFMGSNSVGTNTAEATQLVKTNASAVENVSQSQKSLKVDGRVPNALGAIEYQAESPDDAALVEGVAECGVVLCERSFDQITVQISNENNVLSNKHGLQTYVVLAENAFNSSRKRMSVLLQCEGGEIKLYCKGADSAILPRCREGSIHHSRVITKELSRLASEGLRTLVFAERTIPEPEAKMWLERYHKAQKSMRNRIQQLEDLASEIETQLDLVGFSGVEDKLQEGVPETLERIVKTGVKVWVLTGDKVETAINIGQSCRLITSDTKLVKLLGEDKGKLAEQLSEYCADLGISINDDGAANEISWRNWFLRGIPSNSFVSWGNGDVETSAPSSPSTISSRLSNLEQRTDSSSIEVVISSECSIEEPLIGTESSLMGGTAGEEEERWLVQGTRRVVVVDGAALRHIMEDEQLAKQFLGLGHFCASVIACRISPKQKALVVRLVRQQGSISNDVTVPYALQPVTLAIGDGANDVTMIREAHVGIGIAGKEGRQAVNSSDFAIAQFSFLEKLLLVHGTWNYVRMSKVILICFYKNIALVVSVFTFNLFTLMSGTSLYEAWLYAGFNWITGLPPFLIGAFDQIYTRDVLLAYPQIYSQVGPANAWLNPRIMANWIIRAITHSLVVVIIGFASYGLPSLSALGESSQWPFETSDLQTFGSTVFWALVLLIISVIALESSTWNVPHVVFLVGSLLFFFVFFWLLSSLPFYMTFIHVMQHEVVNAMSWVYPVLVTATCICLDMVLKLTNLYSGK